MRLTCPFCGDRDVGEFSCFGEHPGDRPDPAHTDAQKLFTDYVYLRNNPAGPSKELWYHGQGCRQWLQIVRDTKTHEFISVELVAGSAQ